MTTLISKRSKIYKRRPQIKSFMRRKPPNRSILIQNTILKFTKSKNEIKKCPIKVPKTKNLFKEAY